MPRSPLSSYAALGAAFGQLAVALIVAFGFTPTVVQTGAIEAVTVAVLGLVAAALQRPYTLASVYTAVTGLLTAGLSLLLAYKAPHITPGLLSSVNAVFGVLFYVLAHQNYHRTVAHAALNAAPGPVLHDRHAGTD